MVLLAQSPPPEPGLFDLKEQYNGHYAYTMFGNSLMAGPNQAPGFCEIIESSTATLTLDPNYQITEAYLYYAASGYAIKDVYLNGIKAEFLRGNTYSLEPNYSYYFGQARVTDIIRENGSGEYTFSGLDVLNNALYQYCYESKTGGGFCAPNGDAFAGWAVLVIYEDDSLPYNSISVFDGYKIIGGYSLPTLDVNTSDVSNSSVSFLSWEGDITGANEWFLLNDQPLENDQNSYPNQMFNETNSFSGERSWGMDLDFFNTTDYLNSTTDEAIFKFESSGTCADGAFLQLAVVSIENRLPNPSIEILGARSGICGDTELEITYKVSNPNTTEVLPTGVPINFYKKVMERPLLHTESTTQSLDPFDSYIDTTIVNLDEITLTFTEIEIEINKDLLGQTVIAELNPEDNLSDIRIEDIGKPQVFFPNSFTPNNDGVNDLFYLLNGERCRATIAEMSIEIFNRYGEKIYAGQGVDQTWDGIFETEKVQAGAYLYYASYKSSTNNRTYTASGVVHLIY